VAAVFGVEVVSKGGVAQGVEEVVLLGVIVVVLGAEADHRNVLCIRTGKFQLRCDIRLTFVCATS